VAPPLPTMPPTTKMQPPPTPLLPLREVSSGLCPWPFGRSTFGPLVDLDLLAVFGVVALQVAREQMFAEQMFENSEHANLRVPILRQGDGCT
jgi:hypothetical protein